MPTAKKKAKILSTGSIQKIVDKEMPGFRVVELAPAPEALRDASLRKASRSLPSIVEMRRKFSPVETDAKPGDEPSLWGNSSQFAIVEPKGPAAGSDATARQRRTVLISHGKIIAEQG
ncbi:MAG TPA: hypothetical protein VLQ45_15955 [Thermoanaerobaculia bacterium]|nr:hypothetical protein [Thermoanaerobaculia bacterium]